MMIDSKSNLFLLYSAQHCGAVTALLGSSYRRRLSLEQCFSRGYYRRRREGGCAVAGTVVFGVALGKFTLLQCFLVWQASAWSPFGNVCVVSSTAAMAYEGGILEIAQTEGSVCGRSSIVLAPVPSLRSSLTRFLCVICVPACRLHRDKAIGRGTGRRSWSLWSDHRSSVQR